MAKPRSTQRAAQSVDVVEPAKAPKRRKRRRSAVPPLVQQAPRVPALRPSVIAPASRGITVAEIAEMARGTPLPAPAFVAAFVAAWASSEGFPLLVSDFGIETHARPASDLEQAIWHSDRDLVAALTVAVPVTFTRRDLPSFALTPERKRGRTWQ